MTSELRNYISARREKLQREYDAIQEKAAPLLAELRELKQVEIALSIKGRPGPRGRSANGSEPHVDSIQGRILSVLRDNPSGLVAADIVDRLAEEAGHQVERTSVAPQLSRLLGSGKLTRTGRLYAINPEAKNASRGGGA